MSIFGSIMSKIFHHGSGQAASGASSAARSGVQTATSGSLATNTSGGGVGSSSSQPVDVEAVLTEMAGKAGQTLNWQTSIVDLMKLLGLDSSLTARKELAGELHYSGDTSDSATMNIWLQKQVMQKLAENGGKVPDSLKA